MDEKSKYKVHPIQLIDVKVLKLNFELFATEDVSAESSKGPETFRFQHTHSTIDEDEKRFAVKVRALLDDTSADSDNESDTKWKMEIELVGLFEYQSHEDFSIDRLEAFAERNAPLILYPYLREHVYSCAIRADVERPMLPLFQVPPFKMVKE